MVSQEPLHTPPVHYTCTHTLHPNDSPSCIEMTTIKRAMSMNNQSCTITLVYVTVCITLLPLMVLWRSTGTGTGSGYGSSSSLWAIDHNNEISASSSLSGPSLSDVIAHYESRGNLFPQSGFGTSKFLLQGYRNNAAQGVIRFAIDLAHNFNPEASAWAAVTAMTMLPSSSIPVSLLCRALRWNPGYLRASRECSVRARALAAVQNSTLQEKLYAEVEWCTSFSASKCLSASQERLIASFPEDVDAAAFRAWDWVDSSIYVFGSPLQPQREHAQMELSHLFSAYPWHHGLAHYIVHAWEDTMNPEKALPAAKALVQMAPASPHILHMVGHVYFLLGDYGKASEYFSTSRALEPGPRCTPPSISCLAISSSATNWEMLHNTAFQVMTLGMSGRMKEVERWGESCLNMRPWEEALALDLPLEYSPLASRALSRYYFQCLLAPVDAYLSASMWDKARQQVGLVIDLITTHVDRSPTLRHVISLFAAKRAYASVMSAVFSGQVQGGAGSKGGYSLRESYDVEAAQKAYLEMKRYSSAFIRGTGNLRSGDVSYSVIDRVVKGILCSVSEAEGVVLMARGDTKAAVGALSTARDMSPLNITHSVVPYNEPEVVPRPIAESLGVLYSHLGHFDAARREYESVLSCPLYRGRLWTSFALALLLETQSRRTEACAAYTQILNISWYKADSDLSNIQYAREFVKSSCV